MGPAVEALAPLAPSRAEETDYRQQQALVENVLEEAVDVLLEVGDDFASRYIDLHAKEHMARCLRQFCEQQSRSERDAFIAETNRLRALAGQPPDTWENIVTVVPKRSLLATR